MPIKCKQSGCNIRPNFNYEGEKKGIYCNQHSLLGMIDVKNKRCKQSGCNIQPTFNYEGEKKGVYCAKHSSPEMICVTVKRCKQSGCNIIPNFNYEGEKKGVYCDKHSLPEMIDVKHKKCKESGCNSRPNFGYPSQISTYCRSHALQGMIEKPSKKCIIEKCNNLASCGINKRIHCDKHKQGNERNLVEQKCAKCGLYEILDKNNLCLRYCGEWEHKYVRLAKQNRIKVFLDSHNFNYETCDKQIRNGNQCGKERPDFLFDCGYHYVILEVDENQHNQNLCSCEYTRMINISQTLGLKTIFIRYNPDAFKVKKRTLEISEFKKHKILAKWLKFLMTPQKNIPFLSVLYLFYDEYVTGNSKLININTSN
jgi:hypothetical protein